jgi:hypothetical protein
VFGPSNAFNPFCNADAAGPVDPRASLGVFGSAGRACHVSGPTTPSGVRLFPCWNDLTASRVFGPKLLSMSETSSTFVITKIICSRRTSGPAEPIDKVGPLFMTSSSTPQNAPACNSSAVWASVGDEPSPDVSSNLGGRQVDANCHCSHENLPPEAGWASVDDRCADDQVRPRGSLTGKSLVRCEAFHMSRTLSRDFGVGLSAPHSR